MWCDVVRCVALRCVLVVKAVEEGAVVRRPCLFYSLSDLTTFVFVFNCCLTGTAMGLEPGPVTESVESRIASASKTGRHETTQTRAEGSTTRRDTTRARHDNDNKAMRGDAMIYKAVRDD